MLEGERIRLVVVGLVPGLVTTMLQVEVAVLPFESTTWAVKLYVPAVVGVPVIVPVEVLSVKPGGREPLGIENV
jgi:hypothetical protein